MKQKMNYGLGLVLILALGLRVYYWSDVLLGRDALGYAIGGLGTWCAHSPGFFGYCFAGWLVNQLVANINDSLILINVVTSTLGIYFCHQLAVSFGLSRVNALLATAAYAFSTNLDYLSVVALSHAPEGMFATLFALTCHRAIRQQSLRLTILATVIWSVSGAFRQTSIAFLAPLWLYTVWASGPWRRMFLYPVVALPLILAWALPNAFYQAAYSGDLNAKSRDSFWRLQVMMPTNYDQSKLGMEETAGREATSQYHWPFMEALQWVDEKLDARILPDYRQYGAPPPSLERAAKLALLQFCKLGFYMLFSLPCLLMLVMLVPRIGLLKPLFQRGEIPFFIAWLLPVGCFFIIGHLGHFGYLQIFLSGFSVLAAIVLSRSLSDSQSKGWLPWQKIHVTLTVLALGFFVLARPFRSSDPQRKLLDVVMLQYTGPAIKDRYTASRWSISQPGPALEEEWFGIGTDDEIVRLFAEGELADKPIFKPKVVR